MASKQLYFYADYGYGVDGESSGAAAPGITRRMTGGRAQAGAPPRNRVRRWPSLQKSVSQGGQAKKRMEGAHCPIKLDAYDAARRRSM